MDDVPELRTPRLVLRGWRQTDLPAYAALNADPEVMRFMPAPLDAVATAAAVERFRAHFAHHGFGYWAVASRATGACLGHVGLQVPSFEASFTPCVEIGWRLARAAWGQGLATEAARAALAHGFEVVGLAEVVSFTVPANQASRRVMEKLGMRRDPAGDFDHPRLPAGDPLRRHVLFRLGATAWRSTR